MSKYQQLDLLYSVTHTHPSDEELREGVRGLRC
jgi:hypothetical protein